MGRGSPMNEWSVLKENQNCYYDEISFKKGGTPMQLVSFIFKMNIFEIDIKIKRNDGLAQLKEAKKIEQSIQIAKIEEEKLKNIEIFRGLGGF
jgi:hypothetical protein